MSWRHGAAVVLAISSLAVSLKGQAAPRPQAEGGRPVRRNPPPAQPRPQPAAGQDAQKRQDLQQQVRRGLWRVAKERIGFSDEQMVKLEQTTQRFDQRRRTLAQEEKAQRTALRAEILADTAANQANITAALAQLQALQQQRFELQSDEQKEMATFMTPLQRAKFMALQEQVRKRMQELMRARPDSSGSAAPSP